MKKTKGLLAVSIIMLALLLVALSTATFAWFSSGTSVNIASIAFTASSDSEGGANELILCWDKDNIPARKPYRFSARGLRRGKKVIRDEIGIRRVENRFVQRHGGIYLVGI